MSLQPIPVETFGGLDLLSDPGDLGWRGAIDMLDVALDRPGILRSRDMFSSLVANTTLTSPYLISWGLTGYLACTAASIKLYNGGTLTGTAVAPNQYYSWSSQAIGTASASYLYLADYANVNAVRRLTTTAVISAPAGMPVCAYLGRTPTDNRLVAANIATIPTGASSTASGSLVHFSDAGAPETWGANNWVLLDPGDGETIQGMVAWNNDLYIFKQSKYFIVYGTSPDSSGNPIFNYRAVRKNVGSVGLSVAGPDGVYFAGRSGNKTSIFRARGDSVEDIGRPVRAAFNTGDTPATFTLGTLVLPQDMVFAGGNLRVIFTDITPATSCVFSYDPETSHWTLMRLPDTTVSIGAYGQANNFFIAPSVGANAAVHYMNAANVSTDSLRTPTPLYRSGFSDLGTPNMKRLHSWRLKGSGSPTLKVSQDFGALETGAAVVLGTSPAVAEKTRRYAPRGDQFSWQLSGTGPWSVNSVVANLASVRKGAEHVAA